MDCTIHTLGTVSVQIPGIEKHTNWLMSTYTGQGRGNEKDKLLLSGVKTRSNDQQTSTLDTEPRSPDKSLSPHSLRQKFVFPIPS